MLFNMGKLMVISIFTILKYLTHFGALQGSKGVTKWGKHAHLLTNGHKNPNMHNNAIQHENTDGDIHFHHTKIFNPFGGTPGVKRGHKIG